MHEPGLFSCMEQHYIKKHCDKEEKRKGMKKKLEEPTKEQVYFTPTTPTPLQNTKIAKLEDRLIIKFGKICCTNPDDVDSVEWEWYYQSE